MSLKGRKIILAHMLMTRGTCGVTMMGVKAPTPLTGSICRECANWSQPGGGPPNGHPTSQHLVTSQDDMKDPMLSSTSGSQKKTGRRAAKWSSNRCATSCASLRRPIKVILPKGTPPFPELDKLMALRARVESLKRDVGGLVGGVVVIGMGAITHQKIESIRTPQ